MNEEISDQAECSSAGRYSDPIYKKIAVRNGEINRMTKQQMVSHMQELDLDCRGVKEVLKKRMKNYYKKKDLLVASIKSVKKQKFKYFLVIDYEATCHEFNTCEFKHEIIEFPIVMIDSTTRQKVDEFHSYVRPVVNPKLSDFCSELTGITQKQVNDAPIFTEVLDKAEKWMNSHDLKTKEEDDSFAVVTDGPWDMSRFLYTQCKLSDIPFPIWGKKWINIKKSFCNFYRFNQCKLKMMLQYMGMDFIGQEHSGLDDSRNLARIINRLLEDGAEFRKNEELSSRKCCALMDEDSIDSKLDAKNCDNSINENLDDEISKIPDISKVDNNKEKLQILKVDGDISDLLSYFSLQAS